MATVKENLIAAKALIDTPEKMLMHGGNLHAVQYAFDAVIPPFDEASYADCFRQLRAARNGHAVVDWLRSATHADIMDLFNRAIAAQDGS